jgi:hypothetical protein
MGGIAIGTSEEDIKQYFSEFAVVSYIAFFTNILLKIRVIMYFLHCGMLTQVAAIIDKSRSEFYFQH